MRIPFLVGAILIGIVLVCGCTNTQVNSDPTGADVFINGNYAGQTTYETHLDPAVYTISVRKNGYENFETQAAVSEDTETVINARLVGITNQMKLVYERTITINRNCYAYYRYDISPGKQVTAEVIAPGAMYGFSMFPDEFSTYLRIVNEGAHSSSGIGSINEQQWGSSFKVTNFEPDTGQRSTFYFVIDNTPISHYLTYSDTLPSAGGSVLVRITTDDPSFSLVSESGGCMSESPS